MMKLFYHIKQVLNTLCSKWTPKVPALSNDPLTDIGIKNDFIYRCSNKHALTRTIESPTLMIDPLHFCYAHALIDGVAKYYWAITEIKKRAPDIETITLFVRKELLISQPPALSSLIDNTTGTYKGVWNELIQLLSPLPLIFEHRTNEHLLFKKLYIYPFDREDGWQRTPWNNKSIYPERRIAPRDVRFTDELIYQKFSEFKQHVFASLSITTNTSSTPSLIIIDRKTDRRFSPDLLLQLVTLGQESRLWNFKGVYTLEDLTFKEQVGLFANNNIVIARHSASLANLIWLPHASLVFEISGGPESKKNVDKMYSRLSALSDAKHFIINYDTLDPMRDIYTPLKKYLSSGRS